MHSTKLLLLLCLLAASVFLATASSATEEPIVGTIKDVIKVYKSFASKKDLFIRHIPMKEQKDVDRFVKFLHGSEFKARRFVLSELEGLSDANLKRIIEDGLLQSDNIPAIVAFARNRIGKESCKALAKLVGRGKDLEKLFLIENGINSECIKEIVENGLKKPTGSLTMFSKLAIMTNEIGDEGLKSIAEFVTSADGVNVRDLVLKETGITSGSAADIVKIVQESSLKRLELSGNALGDDVVGQILQVFTDDKNKGSLTHLSLSDAKLKSTKAIPAALRATKTLVRLDLSDNELGDEGVKELIAVLSEKKEDGSSALTLKSLDLSNTGLTDSSVSAVIKTLEDNPKGLAKVYLQRVKLQSEDLKKKLVALADKIVSDISIELPPPEVPKILLKGDEEENEEDGEQAATAETTDKKEKPKRDEL